MRPLRSMHLYFALVQTLCLATASAGRKPAAESTCPKSPTDS